MSKATKVASLARTLNSSTTGNLNFTETGSRITGDFSNATAANRIAFQTSTVNGNSYVLALPNGTGNDVRFQAYNNSDPTNSAFASFGVVGTTDVRVQSSTLGTGTALPMTFYTGGSERMRLDTSGNLGIGTASPGYAIDIQKGNGSALNLYNTTAAANDTTEVQISSLGSYWNYISHNASSFRWKTYNVERMRMDSNGNLGLGCTPSTWSGGRALEVNSVGYGLSAGYGTGLNLSANAYYNSGYKYALTGSASNYVQGGGTHVWQIAPSGTAGNPITFTQAMTLDASGNLGIGTSSGTGKLHTQLSTSFSWGGNWTSGTAVFGGGSGSSGALGISYNDTDGAAIGAVVPGVAWKTIQFNSQDLRFCTTGASERMRIDSNGNVMIGSSAIAGRLGIKTSDTSAGTWGIYCTNSAGTLMFAVLNNGQFYTGAAAGSPYNSTTASAANCYISSDSGMLARSTSSIKYKTDVQDATHGLAEVLSLRPVTYKGKNDGDKVFGGLIAEEVHEAGLIEFVQYADDGTPDALAYSNMVSLCIKAIQEQQEQINELKAEVALLKGV